MPLHRKPHDDGFHGILAFDKSIGANIGEKKVTGCMGDIRQLPDSLINKIAAGEVIERPASVVKELLENSIDAWATQIDVVIEGGGIDLIRIADNGSGIKPDQLLLAVSPHATSKLEVADDLFSIKTLGFRGEALASIAEVSHLTIRSRTAASDSGMELVVRGGDREGPSPCGCPIGSTMEIRNLFYNTPVRKKFLKSPQTETGHTVEAFMRIALANPNVQMTLRSGTRVLYELPPTSNWAERIYNFFGSEVSDALIAIESEDSGVRLRGYVANPSVTRSNNRMQYLFLNGRYIRDRALQHALSEAYRGLIMVGRFPVCFLHIDISPDLVDVNVHPTKSEVRFVDGGAIYRRLLQALRSKFLSTDLTARVDRPTEEIPEFAGITAAPAVNSVGTSAHASNSAWPAPPVTSPSNSFADHEKSLLQWARGQDDDRQNLSSFQLPSRGAGQTVPNFKPFPGAGFPSASSAWDPNRELSSSPSGNAVEPTRDDFDGSNAHTEQQQRIDSSHDSAYSYLGYQVHNRYLITQDERGMVVIDQHALHERILYEQIREKVLARKLETQKLLVPEPVTLTASEAALALEHKDALEQLGIGVEPFGGDCVLITSYPAMLANIAPSDVLRQVIEKLQSEGASPESRDLVDSLLHLIACKAAIKAGDKLTGEEITALLEQRFAYQDTHHCPHGRPTALYFSRQELDKMFKRT